MYATNFEYAGENLSDYGMIICRFDGSGGIETVSSGSDVTFHQIKPSGQNHFNNYFPTYEEPMPNIIQICRNPHLTKNQDEMYLLPEDISALQRWLCRNNYHKFKLEQDGYENIYWNVLFSTKQVNLNGQAVGLELTLSADAPFAYQEEVPFEYKCNANEKFSLYCTSDLEHCIYPNVEITLLESGNFQLQNSLDNKITKINNCKAGEIITIDGKNLLIKFSTAHASSNDFNYFFPRIFSVYNNGKATPNVFTSNLQCIIKLTYSTVKKIGF